MSDHDVGNVGGFPSCSLDHTTMRNESKKKRHGRVSEQDVFSPTSPPSPTSERLARIRAHLPPTWGMGIELEQPEPPPAEDDPDDDGAEMIHHLETEG